MSVHDSYVEGCVAEVKTLLLRRLCTCGANGPTPSERQTVAKPEDGSKLARLQTSVWLLASKLSVQCVL
eukprot:2507355-Amphidinium_carterae.1